VRAEDTQHAESLSRGTEAGVTEKRGVLFVHKDRHYQNLDNVQIISSQC
jgi:hypothetical protein